MPQPKPTESEKEQAYRDRQRVERGEKVAGEQAEFLDDAVEDVREGKD